MGRTLHGSGTTVSSPAGDTRPLMRAMWTDQRLPNTDLVPRGAGCLLAVPDQVASNPIGQRRMASPGSLDSASRPPSVPDALRRAESLDGSRSRSTSTTRRTSSRHKSAQRARARTRQAAPAAGPATARLATDPVRYYACPTPPDHRQLDPARVTFRRPRRPGGPEDRAARAPPGLQTSHRPCA